MRPRFSYNTVEKENNEGVADMKKLKALIVNGSPRAKGCTIYILAPSLSTIKTKTSDTEMKMYHSIK